MHTVDAQQDINVEEYGNDERSQDIVSQNRL
jgi:hypothetical protein